MINLKKYTKVIFVFFIGASTCAQQLSKEEAIKKILANNLDILMAKNNEKTSENNKSILNSGYLPSLEAGATATYEIADSETLFNGALNDDGEVREDIEINNAETEDYGASLDLTYTIFDGLGRLYDYKTFKEQYNLTKLQTRETIENTIYQLFTVYFEVARISENLEVLKETLKISQDRVTRSQLQFDYGQVNKLSVLNAQVDVVNDSINLISEEQNLKVAKRNLNLILNEEMAKDFSVDTIVEFTPKPKIEGYLQSYRQANVTLLQSESNVTISKYNISVNKANFLPSLNFTGSYDIGKTLNPAGAFFPSTTSNEQALSAGLTLSWDLFDGGASITSLKNAKISLENEKLLQQQLVNQVETDIANAESNYYNLLTIFNIQQQNVITNKNNFDRSKEEFKLGRITSIAFREAQLNLMNAETNLNTAKYNAKLAEIELLRLAGQLLNVNF